MTRQSGCWIAIEWRTNFFCQRNEIDVFGMQSAILIIEMMFMGQNDLPCFKGGEQTIKDLKDRFDRAKSNDVVSLAVATIIHKLNKIHGIN